MKDKIEDKIEDKIKEIIKKHTGGWVSIYGHKHIEIRRGELDKIAQDIVKLIKQQ